MISDKDKLCNSFKKDCEGCPFDNLRFCGLDKKIRAYNDNRLIFEGNLSEFLKDNEDSDEFIQDELQKLYTQDTVEIECFHSGSWRIETTKEMEGSR